MRCAIYTRKSSAEGLQQPFNSLDAQRLACSHFIASQASEGWIELPARYDDGGYSGASMIRPALTALLDDVESGAVDVIVVYKIDRLSRSLRDFVHLIGVLERRAVTFTSVTQQFSTTGSMGRLTLNILLSFAQFERDLTSERLRDKFAAVRSKGMRPQGGRPFGFRLLDRRLIVEPAEAEVVRRVYSTFIRLGSATPIPDMLNRDGLLTHRKRPFILSFVRRMLRNALYRGDQVYRGHSTSGVHPRIVSEPVWQETQAIIAQQAQRWRKRSQRDPGMLTGLLFGPSGALLHDGSVSRGMVYRYYGPSRSYRNERPKSDNGRLRARDLEAAVLASIDPDCRLARNEDAARELIRSLVKRVEVGSEVSIVLKTGRTIKIGVPTSVRTSRLQRSFLYLDYSGDLHQGSAASDPTGGHNILPAQDNAVDLDLL